MLCGRKNESSMKTIGLLGGMSWESTLTYYKTINENIKHRLGGLHSAKIAMVSVDFYDIEQLQHQGRWEEAGILLCHASQSIEAAGADFLLICTNTMHKVAEQIDASISIPLLHIADATAMSLAVNNIKCVGLLGTQFTMEEAFYKKRLAQKHGIEVLVPPKSMREVVHNVIYSELCLGVVKPSSRDYYLSVLKTLQKMGAQGVILGCTEIAMLLNQQDTDIPLFNTTEIHSIEAVNIALSST